MLNSCMKQVFDVDYIDFNEFDGKYFLISGATGMIGSAMVNSLVYIAKSKALDITIYALVRSLDKVRAMFTDDVLSYSKLNFITKDITTISSDDFEKVDYVLHTASSTDSRYMQEHGVELIEFTYKSTLNLLELARAKDSAFVYFSSMEVYGTPQTDEKIKEDYSGAPNTMKARSSYPEGKRLCECLCRCYHEEYNVKTFVVRLTQCFGSKIYGKDSRVFATFARDAVNKQDIVLKTEGLTKRNYIYTFDAVMAVFTILIKGDAGEAYNIANEDTYCSIKEMADMVCKDIALGQIKVRFEIEENTSYLPPLKMNLDCSKLRSLGWSSTLGLKEMFEQFIVCNY